MIRDQEPKEACRIANGGMGAAAGSWGNDGGWARAAVGSSEQMWHAAGLCGNGGCWGLILVVIWGLLRVREWTWNCNRAHVRDGKQVRVGVWGCYGLLWGCVLQCAPVRGWGLQRARGGGIDCRRLWARVCVWGGGLDWGRMWTRTRGGLGTAANSSWSLNVLCVRMTNWLITCLSCNGFERERFITSHFA